MNDQSTFPIIKTAGPSDDTTVAAKKLWTRPAMIHGDLADTEHAANTVSDGTGNQFS